MVEAACSKVREEESVLCMCLHVLRPSEASWCVVWCDLHASKNA